MFSLIRHIEFLLTNHDCVVIPGLGAILGVHESATYDEATGWLKPPCRRYAFNSELIESDGLLINSVARSRGIDFRHAVSVVGDAVEQLRTQLKTAGEISLGRIGRLESDDEDIVSFVPFERDLLTPLADWMPVVNASVVSDTSGSEAGTDDSSERRESVRRRHGIRRFVRNTIGAAAAIFIGLTVSTPVDVDNTHQASLEIPAIRTAAVTVPEKSVETIEIPGDGQVTEESSQNDEAAIITVSSEEESVKEVEVIKDDGSDSPRFDDSDKYILVVGSLASVKDAEEYVSHLSRTHKDLKFGVAGQGNRVRIYAATGETMEQARRMMKNPAISSVFKDAWVTARD